MIITFLSLIFVRYNELRFFQREVANRFSIISQQKFRVLEKEEYIK